jgi:hypothetical protein
MKEDLIQCRFVIAWRPRRESHICEHIFSFFHSHRQKKKKSQGPGAIFFETIAKIKNSRNNAIENAAYLNLKNMEPRLKSAPIMPKKKKKTSCDGI